VIVSIACSVEVGCRRKSLSGSIGAYLQTQSQAYSKGQGGTRAREKLAKR
jgi:hypothetical protein